MMGKRLGFDAASTGVTPIALAVHFDGGVYDGLGASEAVRRPITRHFGARVAGFVGTARMTSRTPATTELGVMISPSAKIGGF